MTRAWIQAKRKKRISHFRALVERLVVVTKCRGGWLVWVRVGHAWILANGEVLDRGCAADFADDIRAYVIEGEVEYEFRGTEYPEEGCGMAPDFEVRKVQARQARRQTRRKGK